MKNKSILWAALGALLALTWQSLTVHANYHGLWNGLFCIGKLTPLPPALAASTYRFPNDGYDGQYYRLLAHDPFLRHGTAAYLDVPELRARRILVPALAYALALGVDRWIDSAYILVIAICLFVGIYWLAQSFALAGRAQAWGFLFLLVPATVVSIDRMTVDVALAALSAGFGYFLSRRNSIGLWLILAAAALVRETGLLLTAAALVGALFERQWRRALLTSTAALPALAWFAYLHPTVQTGGAIPSWLKTRGSFGVFSRLVDPPLYGLHPPFEAIARTLDVFALLGMVLVTALALLQMWRSRPPALQAALGLHALFLLSLTNKDFWTPPHGYSRPFGPLFVLLLTGPFLVPTILAMVAVDLRLSTDLVSQALGVWHWL